MQRIHDFFVKLLSSTFSPLYQFLREFTYITCIYISTFNFDSVLLLLAVLLSKVNQMVRPFVFQFFFFRVIDCGNAKLWNIFFREINCSKKKRM